MANLPKPKYLAVRDAQALSEASRQLHFASQYLAAVGQSFLTHAEDDSHTNLGWSWDRGLISRAFSLDQSYHLLLQVPYFRLDLQLNNGGVIRSWPLDGQNQAELYAQLRSFFAERQATKPKTYEAITHYALPEPVLEVFEKPAEYLLETLTNYRHNAQVFLTEAVQARTKEAAVRIWPHHFDTGALFTIERGAQGQAQKTLGIGLAIPDSLSETHYYYINHWAKYGAVDYSELPVLPKGAHWHQGDNVLAILPMTTVMDLETVEEQAQVVRQFFNKGIPASQQLLQTAVIA